MKRCDMTHTYGGCTQPMPVKYKNGKIVPAYLFCWECLEIRPNKWDAAIDSEDYDPIYCHKCGTQLSSRRQLEQANCHKNDIIYKTVWGGWTEERQAEEYEKWVRRGKPKECRMKATFLLAA